MRFTVIIFSVALLRANKIDEAKINKSNAVVIIIHLFDFAC